MTDISSPPAPIDVDAGDLETRVAIMRKSVIYLLVLMLAFAPLLMGQDDVQQGGAESAMGSEQNVLPEDDGRSSESNRVVESETDEPIFTMENIVLEIDDAASSRAPSIFSWREKDSGLDGDARVRKLMEEAAFQSKIGNLEGAVDIYEKVLELDADNALANFNRGTALVQIKRYQEALEVLLPLMEQYPDNYMLKNNTAWVYATAEDVAIRSGEKALSLARDALLLAPGDFHIWHTLSEAYFVSAMYEKANQSAEISLRMALSQGEESRQLQTLSEQIRKCRQAMATMSIME